MNATTANNILAYTYNNTPFSQAVKAARRWPHGCQFHQEAMTVIYCAYREFTHDLNPSLDTLWNWVNGVLQSASV